MNAAPQTPDPGPGASDRTPREAGTPPSRSARLLGLIRGLIAVGRQRLAMIRSQPGPEDTRTLANAFGTFNMALIVARIMRGLRLAGALEQRAIATAARIDAPPRPRPATVSSDPRPPRPPRSPQAPHHDDAALLAGLPDEHAIAEQVRRRPIGAVLADIGRDLGIDSSHPLWQELQALVIDHNGNVLPLLLGTFRRIYDAYQDVRQSLLPAPPLAAGTGPP